MNIEDLLTELGTSHLERSRSGEIVVAVINRKVDDGPTVDLTWSANDVIAHVYQFGPDKEIQHILETRVGRSQTNSYVTTLVILSYMAAAVALFVMFTEFDIIQGVIELFSPLVNLLETTSIIPN